MLLEEARERVDESGTCFRPTWVSGPSGEDEPVMSVVQVRRPAHEQHVVPDILGDQATSLHARGLEDLGVGTPAEVVALSHSYDIVSKLTKAPGDLGIVMLVEEQLQSRARARWRRQAASARTASSSFARIQSSISSVWSP